MGHSGEGMDELGESESEQTDKIREILQLEKYMEEMSEMTQDESQVATRTVATNTTR